MPRKVAKIMRMQPLLACAVIIVYSILKSVILLLYDKLHHKIQRRSYNMTFAEKLKSIRKQVGMSQELLAEKIGVSRQAVTKW